MRGCFGGCTFCSITAHEGRIIQSRSQESILARSAAWPRTRTSRASISDLGGPTANMYQMNCTRPEVEAKCRRLSLRASDDLQAARHRSRAADRPDEGGPRGSRASRRCSWPRGIRMDLARRSPAYMRELAEHHVGGQLKVAPEHTDPEVLRLMKKPPIEDFEAFAEAFAARVAQGRQEAVPRAVLHRRPSGLRPRRDDRPGRVPEAERLPARQGAGLHPRPDGHRHVHVLHGHRSVHERAGLRRPAPRASAAAAGAAAVLQAGELRRRPRGAARGGPRRPDRRRAATA